MESAHHVHHAPAFSRRLAAFRVECRSAAHITERQFTTKAAKRPKPPLFTHLSTATSWALGFGPHATPTDYLVLISGPITISP
jgi:hypothetical protein